MQLFGECRNVQKVKLARGGRLRGCRETDGIRDEARSCSCGWSNQRRLSTNGEVGRDVPIAPVRVVWVAVRRDGDNGDIAPYFTVRWPHAVFGGRILLRRLRQSIHFVNRPVFLLQRANKAVHFKPASG